MTTQTAVAEYPSALIYPEDSQKILELLETRKFNGYNLLFPEESTLVRPYLRKFHIFKDESGFLVENFSHSAYEQEEAELGPTKHSYDRAIFSKKNAAGKKGHFHPDFLNEKGEKELGKKERFIVKSGAIIYAVQKVEEINGKPELTGELEHILLYADPHHLKQIDENDRCLVFELHIMGFPPYIAHWLTNPLEYTIANQTILAQRKHLTGDTIDIKMF